MKLRRRLEALEAWSSHQRASREILEDGARKIRLMAPKLGIAPDRLLEIFREEVPSGVLNLPALVAILEAVKAEKTKRNLH